VNNRPFSKISRIARIARIARIDFKHGTKLLADMGSLGSNLACGSSALTSTNP
jgi:hypothetical protein